MVVSVLTIYHQGGAAGAREGVWSKRNENEGLRSVLRTIADPSLRKTPLRG